MAKSDKTGIWIMLGYYAIRIVHWLTGKVIEASGPEVVDIDKKN